MQNSRPPNLFSDGQSRFTSSLDEARRRSPSRGQAKHPKPPSFKVTHLIERPSRRSWSGWAAAVAAAPPDDRSRVVSTLAPYPPPAWPKPAAGPPEDARRDAGPRVAEAPRSDRLQPTLGPTARVIPADPASASRSPSRSSQISRPGWAETHRTRAGNRPDAVERARASAASAPGAAAARCRPS